MLKLEMWRCSAGKEPHVKITTTVLLMLEQTTILYSNIQTG